MITLIVTGNITADAITREYNSNTVTSFTVASNNRYKQKDGTYKDETTFIRCAIWNRPEVAKLFFKGRVVNVQGTQIKPNSYADSSGNLIVNLDLRVNNFQVFGKGKQETETQKAAPQLQGENKVEPYGEHNDPNDELLNRIVEQEQEKEFVDDLPF
jgi:single-strand DNA-binding protein